MDQTAVYPVILGSCRTCVRFLITRGRIKHTEETTYDHAAMTVKMCNAAYFILRPSSPEVAKMFSVSVSFIFLQISLSPFHSLSLSFAVKLEYRLQRKLSSFPLSFFPSFLLFIFLFFPPSKLNNRKKFNCIISAGTKIRGKEPFSTVAGA